MEQRKVLLIIVSVAVVLAAIIGAGIFLFYPRDQVEPAVARDRGVLEWEPLDYLRGVGERPGLEPEPAAPRDDEGDFVVTYGVTEPERPPRTTPLDQFVAEEPPVAAPVEIAAPGDTAVPVEPDAPPPVRPAPVAAPAAPAARPATTAREPAIAPEPAVAPAPPVARPAPALADSAYWVQVISSPNRDTVEQAGQRLREHQLGSRIVTREINGTLYYRLRLGPFAVRDEAEKFLGWVRRIDGFADAMIFVDYTTAVSAAPRR